MLINFMHILSAQITYKYFCSAPCSLGFWVKP